MLEEELKKLMDTAGVLVDWVLEMKTLVQNPYSAGLNIQKVLDDLQGYASDLVRQVAAAQKKIAPPEDENEKAESASVEQ